MIKNPNKLRWLFVILILFWLISWWYYFNSNSNNSNSIKKTIIQKEIKLKTSEIKISNDFNSLTIFWKIISNEIANIYPRRQWIIKDILVDIWDEIYEWQTLAILLPPWVEGQSSSSIREKRAKVKLAQDEYNNSKLISSDSINLSENMLITIGSSTDAWVEAKKQIIETSKANLEISKWNLEKAITDKETKDKNNKNNLVQKIEQTEITVIHTKQEIQNLITKWWTSDDFWEFSPSDFPNNFWALDPTTIEKLFSDFRKLKIEEEKYEEKSLSLRGGTTKQSSVEKNNFSGSIVENSGLPHSASLHSQWQEMKNNLFNLIKFTNELLNSTEKMFLKSSTSNNFSKEDLNNSINKIHNLQEVLLSKKENIEDAFNWIEIFLSTQDEKITKMKNEIISKEEMLKSSEEGLNVANKDKDKNISNAKKALSLTKTQQIQKIEKAKNALNSANATLQAELAKSGHINVISPFSWKISKRLIEVWENISSNKSIFELDWVGTSLSQKAKKEIVFGLPEEYFDVLNIWDEIEFFVVNKENKIYKAKVSKKSSQIDSMSHTIEVRAKVENEINFPHKTSIRVKIKTTKYNIYKVLRSFIRKKDNQNYIWIKNEEKVEKLFINLISDDWEFADIQSETLTWGILVVWDNEMKIEKYIEELKKL